MAYSAPSPGSAPALKVMNSRCAGSLKVTSAWGQTLTSCSKAKVSVTSLVLTGSLLTSQAGRQSCLSICHQEAGTFMAMVLVTTSCCLSSLSTHPVSLSTIFPRM